MPTSCGHDAWGDWIITPLTMATLVDHPRRSDFTEDQDAGYGPTIELGIWGDLILVAPAGQHPGRHGARRLRQLVQAVLLSARCPVAVAPAMDLDMFTHDATQSNLATLKSAVWTSLNRAPVRSQVDWWARDAWLNPKTLPTTSSSGLPKSSLCGQTRGHHRRPHPRTLGRRAFPREPKFRQNGLCSAEALAAKAQRSRWWPVLSPPHARPCAFTGGRVDGHGHEHAVQKIWPRMDLGIACAAVSDFRPAVTSEDKWHRGDVPPAVELIENPDILAGMGAQTAPSTVGGIRLGKRRRSRKR